MMIIAVMMSVMLMPAQMMARENNKENAKPRVENRVDNKKEKKDNKFKDNKNNDRNNKKQPKPIIVKQPKPKPQIVKKPKPRPNPRPKVQEVNVVNEVNPVNAVAAVVGADVGNVERREDVHCTAEIAQGELTGTLGHLFEVGLGGRRQESHEVLRAQNIFLQCREDLFARGPLRQFRPKPARVLLQKIVE